MIFTKSPRKADDDDDDDDLCDEAGDLDEGAAAADRRAGDLDRRFMRDLASLAEVASLCSLVWMLGVTAHACANIIKRTSIMSPYFSYSRYQQTTHPFRDSQINEKNTSL
jgi:hypothetical protein